LKIIIDEILAEFKELYPDCTMVTWEEQDGVIMHCENENGRSNFVQEEFKSDSPISKLFDKANDLVNAFFDRYGDK